MLKNLKYIYIYFLKFPFFNWKISFRSWNISKSFALFTWEKQTQKQKKFLFLSKSFKFIFDFDKAFPYNVSNSHSYFNSVLIMFLKIQFLSRNHQLVWVLFFLFNYCNLLYFLDNMFKKGKSPPPKNKTKGKTPLPSFNYSKSTMDNSIVW